MKVVRIAITGTHSTGKTSFCKTLSEKLVADGNEVKCVEDLASEASKLGFPILKEHTHDSTLWIISQGIACELKAALNSKVVIVDRGVPDALGYWLAALEARRELADPRELGRITTIVKEHTKMYDLMFNTIMDPSVELGPDRDTDMEFRASAEKHIVNTLKEIGSNPIPLANGCLDSAMQLVFKFIEHAKNGP